jgi:two-component system cell cycle response regulator DivK
MVCAELKWVINMGTILVVEDYDDVRRMLKILLESEKFRVLEAATGTEALEVLEDQRPDAILMDLALPGIDGFETIRRIRAIDAFQNTPIVVLSAYSGMPTYETALRAGGNYFMSKPIDFDDLAALMKEILSGRNRRNSKRTRAPIRRSVLSAALGTKPMTAPRPSPDLRSSV